MKELSDAFILQQKRMVDPESARQFSLTDLVGKTIVAHRKIKNKKKYNPRIESIESLNPEFFDVLLFSDNTFLLTESVGEGEVRNLYCYFYDGQKTLYNDMLF